MMLFVETNHFESRFSGVATYVNKFRDALIQQTESVTVLSNNTTIGRVRTVGELLVRKAPDSLLHSLALLVVPKGYKFRIVTVHDTACFDLPQARFHPKFVLMRGALIYACNHADLIITLSRFTAGRLRELGVPWRKLVTVPPGGSFPPIKWLGGGGFYLTVSSDRKHKNLDLLLHVFESSKNLRDATLVIVGASPKDNLRFGGRVSWLKNITAAHLAQLYQDCEAVIVPSLYEGFGFPVLDAILCSAPLICSDLPPFREIGGDYPTYFDPVSAEELSNIISNQRYEEKVIPQHLHRFNWAESAKKHLQIYKNAQDEVGICF